MVEAKDPPEEKGKKNCVLSVTAEGTETEPNKRWRDRTYTNIQGQKMGTV